jgi:SAM-dependent methyltransferase
MTSREQYFYYLRGRSRLGLWYRRLWLYPRLCRYLEGEALDVGCGIGDFLNYRPHTTGVDINPASVEWCNQQGLDARIMSPDNLPFEDCTFDSAILDNVLEHLDEPQALLGEIYRVMRPKGTLVVGVPGRRGYASDPDHKIFYDEASLISTLTKASFGLQKILDMPLRSNWLTVRMSQHCVYGVFRRD